MEAALIESIQNAAEAPGFGTFVVVLGLVLFIAYHRRVIVPGYVATLETKLAVSEANEASLKAQNAELKARIVALEHQLGDHK